MITIGWCKFTRGNDSLEWLVGLQIDLKLCFCLYRQCACGVQSLWHRQATMAKVWCSKGRWLVGVGEMHEVSVEYLVIWCVFLGGRTTLRRTWTNRENWIHHGHSFWKKAPSSLFLPSDDEPSGIREMAGLSLMLRSRSPTYVRATWVESWVKLWFCESRHMFYILFFGGEWTSHWGPLGEGVGVVGSPGPAAPQGALQ